MGDANRKGPYQVRVAAAKARIDAIRPKVIICNLCKAELTEVVDLDSRGLGGIEGVFAAQCPSCEAPTYAIKGDPQAVRNLMTIMASAADEVPIAGIQTTDGKILA